MNIFFTKKILTEIKRFESETTKKKSFLSENDCAEFIDYFKNIKKKSLGKSQSVDREESTKILIFSVILSMFPRNEVSEFRPPTAGGETKPRTPTFFKSACALT